MIGMRTQIEQLAWEWWRQRRPLSYREGDHLANPTVNCSTDAEARLARAVADRIAETLSPNPKKSQ